MRIVYTHQSQISLEEVLNFLLNKQGLSRAKVKDIRKKVLDKVDGLIQNPLMGQKEPLLESLGLEHRRLVIGHLKVIYRVAGDVIFVTDFFDSRQDPNKMKR